MSANIDALEPGDIIEIQYRVWRPTGGRGEDVVEKWINASVLARDAGTWPLVRLADGQVTEIRPFMTWRPVHSGKRRKAVAIAA